MTATIATGKNGRLYPRRFDYDEALARHAAGEMIKDLAAEYGVSYSSVHIAVTPGSRQRMIANNRRWRTGTCEECGGPAMRLVSTKIDGNPDGRTLCNACRGKASRTAIRLSAVGAVVEVRCFNCDAWLEPKRFPKGKRYKDLRDGGFHNCCRACLTALRRDYRERHKIPCTNCGQPRLPKSEKAAGKRVHLKDSGLCADCYVDTLRKKSAA